MCFCTSHLSTISLQSCSWGAHHCLRQGEPDNALASARQVGELIKCMSTADLQRLRGGRGQSQFQGLRAGDGLRGLQFLETQGLALGRTGLGPASGPHSQS